MLITNHTCIAHCEHARTLAQFDCKGNNTGYHCNNGSQRNCKRASARCSVPQQPLLYSRRRGGWRRHFRWCTTATVAAHSGSVSAVVAHVVPRLCAAVERHLSRTRYSCAAHLYGAVDSRSMGGSHNVCTQAARCFWLQS